MATTIQIDNKLKEKLNTLKIHHRESYNELIFRLLENSSPNNFDRESLIETIEVLSDPKIMRGIAEALREKGGTPLEECERDL